MGFFDFLFGGFSRPYSRVAAWASKRVGPIKDGMTDSEKEEYVMSVSSHVDPKKRSYFLDCLRRHIEKRK